MIFYKLRSVRKLKLELNSSFLQRRVGENVSQYGPFSNISGDKVKTIRAALYLCTLHYVLLTFGSFLAPLC